MRYGAARSYGFVLISAHLEMFLATTDVFKAYLGGGNSNIFYVHLDPWGNDPKLTSIFFKWVGSTTN